MMRRVLFISYAFPPTGGGGVQRSVKFTKYLPEFGWQPTVLTVANPSVPVRDESLLTDLDSQTEVIRARTWEPGYQWKRQLAGAGASGNAHATEGVQSVTHWKQSLKRWTRDRAMAWLQPDPQVLWNRSAYRVASDFMKRQPHHAIFVTGPPFSSFLLGCDLKRKFELPLVLDFRDEWMLACRYLDNHQQSGKAALRQHHMMVDVLATADAVIATTQASAVELNEQCRSAGSQARVSCIHNGFDPSDIPTSLRPTEAASQRFRLVYTGTLWRLTNIKPLVDAIIHLHKVDPELINRLELVLAGRRTPEQDAVLKPLERTTVSLVRHDYLPHEEALQLAADADALLLLLSDDEGAERVVPAKLFEYLALRRPVLAICPDGETSELLGKHGGVPSFRNHEHDEIQNWLAESIGKPDDGSFACDRSDLMSFSRRALTSRLSGVLSNCLASKEDK